MFRKTGRSPEGNVDVEPPSSMDDSSMIMIEIGVDVDEVSCYVLSTTLDFLEEERMMQQSSVSISLSF